MKYYLVTVQYNKEKKAENRPQPRKFDSLFDAEAEFHGQVNTDMKNATLGGSLNTVIDSNGIQYPTLTKAWGVMEEPEITE